MEGCGMATMDKCYGTIPPDGSNPSNLIEVISKPNICNSSGMIIPALNYKPCLV